jgi:hypothetical protein
MSESDVLAANLAFYRAFSTGDLVAMEGLWSRQKAVACVHPGWTALLGREAVMGSWHSILSGREVTEVRCQNATVHVLTEECAFVVCEERIGEGTLVATNTFVRESGRWRMVHHQAAPILPEEDDGDATVGDDEDDGDRLN